MKRILLSLALMLTAGAALAAGSTGAFLSDTETSTGNTFTAGAIDLKIDNHSFYNGNECKEVTPGVFQWVGTALFPVPGTSCTTTWSLDDLSNGSTTIHKFFDFQDIKPSDYSEDTISLHVNNNDAYLCANVKLTSNDENTCTTPELKDEPGCTSPGLGKGQLAQNVNFIWWADTNGDNVLEDGEQVISSGPIGAIGNVGDSVTVPLADSQGNIWNPNNAPGPLPGGQTKYIGKAWCFGTITPAPLPAGTFPNGPAGDNNSDGKSGTPEDGGYHCDGSKLDNSTQTDSLTADVTFNAMQSRNNGKFMCVKKTSLTLVKAIDNTGGGTGKATDWTLSAAGPTPISGKTGDASVTNATVTAGTYSLSESGGPLGYTASTYSCVTNGGVPVAGNSITLASGDSATCTITNVFKPAKLTVTKVVVNNNGGKAQVVDFLLFVDDGSVTTGVTSGVQATLPPGAYSVLEQGVSGYQASYTGNCDASGNITLASGDVKTCTITNTELPAHITLIKNVTGTLPLASNTLFGLTIDGNSTPTGASVAVASNAPHTINEGGRIGYTFVSITGDAACPLVLGGTATLSEGQAITCTITNHKN